MEKFLNARMVTAVVGIIAAVLGWTEQFQAEIINQVMAVVGSAAMLLGNVFPNKTDEE